MLRWPHIQVYRWERQRLFSIFFDNVRFNKGNEAPNKILVVSRAVMP